MELLIVAALVGGYIYWQRSQSAGGGWPGTGEEPLAAWDQKVDLSMDGGSGLSDLATGLGAWQLVDAQKVGLGADYMTLDSAAQGFLTDKKATNVQFPIVKNVGTTAEPRGLGAFASAHVTDIGMEGGRRYWDVVIDMVTPAKSTAPTLVDPPAIGNTVRVYDANLSHARSV